MLGKTDVRRRRGQQRTRWLYGITNNGQEFEQAPGNGEGQGSLACCSPWGHKESDTTERLNNSSSILKYLAFHEICLNFLAKLTELCGNSRKLCSRFGLIRFEDGFNSAKNWLLGTKKPGAVF